MMIEVGVRFAKLMLALAIIAGIALFLSSCAPALWVKPGATKDDFAKDKWDCAVRARYMTANVRGNGFAEGEVYQECMQDHGWRRG